MEALLQLLRYLRDNMNLGLKLYSDNTMSPITLFLSSQLISLDTPLCTFTDPSWNGDIDTGRSSGYLACMATAHLKHFLEDLE
jgi:hypothetical protein